MSVKVTYEEKTRDFEPTDKVSKVVEKLNIKQYSQSQWLINDIPVEKPFTKSSTLQSLGIKENDRVTILPKTQQQKKQENQKDDINSSIAQQPSNPFPSQQNNLITPKVITNQIQIKPQISDINSINQLPKFEETRILVQQKPVQSNKPNPKLPDIAQKNIYGYDVRILEKGCKVEISKPNHEFQAVLLMENTKQEESLKVKFLPDEVHAEPYFSLRIGSSELGGTKVLFLRGGKGCGIQWHNGLETKLQFWQDE